MRLSLSSLLDRWLAPPPDPARVAWIGRGTFAHRGRHDAALPENSPSAFAAAMAQNLGIECDVQLSGDGRAMVFHDATLERMTGQGGAVAGFTAAQLQTTRVHNGTKAPHNGSKAPHNAADTIPTLQQLLHQVAAKVPLLIEIKSTRQTRIEPLCQAVHDDLTGYSGAHAIMSFDPRVSRWFAAHAPGTVRGLVMSEEHDRGLVGSLRRHAWLWLARPDFLAYDIRDLPSRFAASQRARGLAVATWTIRSPELRARAKLHADAPIAEEAGLA